MKTLDMLSDEYNFSYRQAKWLSEFCNGDLKKTELLLNTLNKNLNLRVPDNSYEVNEILKNL